MPQLPLIREVVDALQIPTLEVDGVEADDVIATLATRAADAGTDVVIVTGDRDTYQLVRDPHLKVLYNRRGVSDYVLYDEAGIVERTGVTAAQYPEYAALRGDPSDNLPGVPGVGEKTAAKLVSTYGTLEEIFEHLDELPPKQRQNLADARERVFLNREMSLLRCDLALDVGPGELHQGAWDREQVRVLFDQLAFRTLLPRLLDALGEQAADVEAGESFDVDVEPMREADEHGRAARADRRRRCALRGRARVGRRAGHEPAAGHRRRHRRPGRLRRRRAPRRRRPCTRRSTALVAVGGPPLVAHRAKELVHGLGVDVRTLADDTAVMAYLINPGESGYRLEDLALKYLSVELTSPDAEPGTLDFDGQAEIDGAGRRRPPCSVLRWRCARRWPPVSSSISTSASRSRWCGCLGGHHRQPLVEDGDRLGRMGAGDDVLALGVEQDIAIELGSRSPGCA